jgi:amino acid permease
MHYGTAITVAVDGFVSDEGLMGNLDWRRVASGIALIIATLALVLLHKLDYSQELQFFGIVLVGAFGFLFLSYEPAHEEPWW